MLSIKKLPGLLVCGILAGVAWFLGHQFTLIGGPVFAIFCGMLAYPWLGQKEQLQAGIQFSSKYVLQIAVVLLGFGLNLGKVMEVGLSSLPIILSTIATALLIAFLAHKFWKIDADTAILVGVGSAICGGSAIAATASVIEAEEKEVAKAISVIFFFNILAALLFPSLGKALGLSHEGFALFAGTAVNDTSSVTATATAWDALYYVNTLDQATIVKLTRTLAIIPITLGLSLMKAKQGSEQRFSFKKSFPTFLLYFILASLVTTLFDAAKWDSSMLHSLKDLSKFMIVMAMAAIGLKTNFKSLVTSGGKALILGGLCWLGIILVSLSMQALLGLW